jgi:hypothetical protein
VILGAGEPVVVTVKLNGTPKAAVSPAALMMTGVLAGVTLAGSLAPESSAVVRATTVML